MKKTEKMNIGGFAFYVEEDAAAMLESYLDSIQKEPVLVIEDKE